MNIPMRTKEAHLPEFDSLEPRLLLSAMPGGAGTAGQSQTLADLPAAVQSAISADIGRDQAQYHAAAGAGGLTLANPANGFTAQLQSGVLVVDSGADSWRMSLVDFGYGGLIGPVGAATAGSADNRVDLNSGAIDEWLVNGPGGLEQGFTVAPSLQPGAADSSLTVELALDGTLVAAANAAGDGLTLTRQAGLGAAAASPDGSKVLYYTGLAACDSTGRALPVWLQVIPDGSGQELLIHINTAGAQGAITIDPLLQADKLTASDGAAGDRFGDSVAIDGKTMVVGAQAATIGANSGQGAAYVFVESGSGWSNVTQAAKLTASDGAAGDAFGCSVAVSGDTVVVGASSAAVGVNAGQGAAYVFVEPGSDWSDMTQTAKLTASDGAAGDAFGCSVAVSGETVVVGAHFATVGAHAYQGAAYVFAKPVSGWSDMTQTAKLTASDWTIYNDLGDSVAISGNTVVAGAHNAAAGGHSFYGAAYVFVEPNSGWSDMTQTAKLTASDGAANDEFGLSVAIDAQTVVVGAYTATIGGNQYQGAAYVFVEPNSGWSNMTQTAKLTSSDGAEYDYFGYSVAVSGDTVMVGAYDNFNRGAYVFAKPGAGWSNMTQTAKLTPSDGTSANAFGWSVAISGDFVVVGATYATVGGNASQGAAYVYREGFTPPVVTTSADRALYIENSAPIAVDPGITVGDVDCPTLAGATVTLSGNHAFPEDLLGFTNQNGITGSWDAVTGVLTLSGISSVANYQAALRSVTYSDTLPDVIAPARTVSFVADNGSSVNNLSAPATRTVLVTGPAYVDLTGLFGNIWTLPPAVLLGFPLTGYVSVVVGNQGSVALPNGQLVNIQVVAHDTTNGANPDITLVTLTNQSVSGLRPNGSKQFIAHVDWTGSLGTDTYQILANVIPVGNLTELRTDNNQASHTAGGATEMVASGPAFVDLTGQFGPGMVLPRNIISGGAGRIYVPVVVRNQGNVALAVGQKIDIEIDADDGTMIKTLTGLSVSALGPGASVTFRTYVTLPWNLDTGTYHLVATVDSTGLVPGDTDLDNNSVTSSGSMNVTSAELAPDYGPTSAWTVPENRLVGQPLAGWTSVYVTNPSNVESPQGEWATMHIVAEDMTNVNTPSIVLGSRNIWVGAIAPGASRLFYLYIDRPQGLPADFWALDVDFDGLQFNIAPDGVTVTAPMVELAGYFGESMVLPASATSGDGQRIYVPVGVWNGGDLPLQAGLRIDIEIDAYNDNTGVSTPIKTLTGQPVGGLGANAGMTIGTYVTLPISLTTGNYQLVVTVDTTDKVITPYESDKTAMSDGTIAVTQGTVDLAGVFGTLWTLPSAIVTGQALRGYASVVVSNIGTVPLPAGQLVNIQLVASDTTNPANPDITLATLENLSVSSLPAGGAKQFNAYVNQADALPSDDYEILANIIPVGNLAESRTDNNQVSQTAAGATRTVASTAPFVDLSGAFGLLWTLPSSIAVGAPLAGYATVVVGNDGNVPLPAGQSVNIQLVARDTTNGANPDITLATSSGQSVSALPAGGTKSFRVCVDLPSGLPADSYRIFANIIPAQTLAESRTDNNTVLTNTLGQTLGITVS